MIFASKKSENIILLWEKYCNYPLTTTLGDRFGSCENIVSRSQTSSLPSHVQKKKIHITYRTSTNVYIIITTDVTDARQARSRH